jgi:hypothetical protein
MTAAAVAPVARATSRAPAPPPRGPSRGAVRAGVARRRRRLLRASAVPESSSSSSDGGFGAGVGSSATTSNPLDDHVPIDRFYPGMRQLHASPDVFVVDGFLSDAECDSIVAAAKTRAMDQSPVVYAGWTNDVGDVVSTVARGPAIWGATLAMLATSSTRGPGGASHLITLTGPHTTPFAWCSPFLKDFPPGVSIPAFDAFQLRF